MVQRDVWATDQTSGARLARHCARRLDTYLRTHRIRKNTGSVSLVSRSADVHTTAGEGSALHKEYGVYMQHVGIVTVPENYTDRMTLMFPTAFRRLLLLGLEAHDLALSKLERNSARDREDIKYLARVAPLDLSVLESRYQAELRPYLANTERHDLTMRLWLEMLSGA